MINICAIVLAAGKGSRLKSKVSKPLVRLGQKPVLAYSLEVLSGSKAVSSLIITASRSNMRSVKRYVASWPIEKPVSVVMGGRRRQDSVWNALQAIPAECSHVLVHDAARPFVQHNCLARLMRAVSESGAVIPAVPVKATIKEVFPSRHGKTGVVRSTLERALLWEAQTPQLFSKDVILKAYKNCNRIDATDDAFLVEKLGVPVAVVMGSYGNIKITTPDDLFAARAFLHSRGR